MADVDDITKYFAETLVTPACYPNGLSQPSITGLPIRVMEGWPNGDQLDLDVAGKMLVNGVATPNGLGPATNISIFPINMGNSTQRQQIEDPQVVVPAVHGLTISIAGSVITASGTPSTGEYLTVIVNGNKIYSRVGATLSIIMAALLTDIVADFPDATGTSTTLTLPTAHSLDAKSGAPVTMGQVLYRQAVEIMVTIWAPDHATRKIVSEAVDVQIKSNLTIQLPDTSQAIMTFARSMISDADQSRSLYRRDLIYVCAYSTIETFTAYEVTGVLQTTTDNGSSTTVTVGA